MGARWADVWFAPNWRQGDEDEAAHVSKAHSSLQLAQALALSGKPAEALQHATRARDIYSGLPTPDPMDVAYR